MSSTDLKGKRILVTGGAGFLGRHLVTALREHGADPVAPSSRDCDLRRWDAAKALMETCRPEVVFHLAARVGGIGANRAHPGSYFFDTAMMGLHVVELARLFEVRKLVIVGTVCSYPSQARVPFSPADLWNGYPEETNAPYGIAKRALLVQAQAYRQEFGLNAIFIMPTNLYGPGDNFKTRTSHVIPAMIRKFHEARERDDACVTLWGDGSPTREFLHVNDAAAGLLLLAQRYDEPEPLNLGSGDEISIRDLAELISRLVGYRGDIVWDTSQPSGQMRRSLNCAPARALGYFPQHDFNNGLRETIQAYLERGGEAKPC